MAEAPLPNAAGSVQIPAKPSLSASSLPPELRAIVEKVLKKSKLWRSERADVEAELAAHFRDGLESGTPSEQLARDFGDPRSAARLIRRGKYRNRPLWWRTAHRGAQAVFLAAGLAVAFTCIHVVRFYMGEPTLRFNPANEMNKEALATPENERAWPIYRQALLAGDLTPAEQEKLSVATLNAPTDEQYEQVKPLLTRSKRVLELTRQAAARPALGYIAGHSTDHELALHFWKLNGKNGNPPQADPPVGANENREAIGILFPHLGQLRQLTRLLRADGYAAIREGDGDRFAADISALISLSKQVRKPDALISSLVGAAIATIPGDLVRDALASKPDLLSDSQLRDLAHQLAALGSAQDFISLRGERLFFDDYLQRAYTDDGDGNGRFTPEGARYARAIGNTTHGVPPLYAISSMAIADRKDLHAKYHSVLDRAEAELHSRPWQLDKARPRPGEQLDIESSGMLTGLRYEAISLLLPALGKTYQVATNLEMERDAVVTAIAIEIFRRKHGKFPAELNDLVPALLPALPLDNADGQPLRYRPRSDGCTLYSLGSDGLDAGGKPASNQTDQQHARNFLRESTFAAPCDWVLFPREPHPVK